MKKTNVEMTCPRCLGAIPNIMTPGFYPGAISRADNKTEICSACGEEEAMDDFSGIAQSMLEEWPVTKNLTSRFAGARERCGMWMLKQEVEFSPEALELEPRRHPSIGNAE